MTQDLIELGVASEETEGFPGISVELENEQPQA
jgi:hypothetical protein